MAIFKCKMCGGQMTIDGSVTVGVCPYCGTTQTFPKLCDERRANLYDRANHFRRNNEFDKAMGIYEQILNEDKFDSEAYWSLVLCRYGIEYVEDPASKKRVPTVNRAQFTSIFDDADYKSAMENADELQKRIYVAEARAINEIQKGILAVSQREEPFDVFICYKETDDLGRRTPDSVLANDLYHQLTQEGFKVFFSRITLEDKLGSAYEPYIFAALNSAKVMVVIGTRPEHFNAVWVKNEWSRYLSLVGHSNGKKMLIPAYKDMDPYDLPEEFSHLQAQDMSRLGFMQDLIRGIKKITNKNQPQAVNKNAPSNNTNVNVGALVRRVFLFLEDGDWKGAKEYCEKILDFEPENANAYIGKLMVDLKIRRVSELAHYQSAFNENANYQKALRFGDKKTKAMLMNFQNERIYSQTVQRMQSVNNEQGYREVASVFASIGNYKDSAKLARLCTEYADCSRNDAVLAEAKSRMVGEKIQNYKLAQDMLMHIRGWRDADQLIELCNQKIKKLQEKIEREEKKAKKRKKISTIVWLSILGFFILSIVLVILNFTVFIPNSKYDDAVELMNSGKYQEALVLFGELDDHKDSEKYFGEILKKRSTDETISAGYQNTLGLKSDGTVVGVGNNFEDKCNVSEWKDIVAVSAGGNHTVGLKSNGTAVAVGYNEKGQCNVSKWKDIVAVSAGDYHTVGLKSDGTVVAVGDTDSGRCDVSEWKDIVAVSAGGYHTVGLKSDGTVVAVGYNDDGRCDVSDWKDIIAVSAGDYHTVGLKSDGTVVAVGSNYDGRCNVSRWKNIVAVSAGDGHTVGLKSDGTVVAVGDNENGQCNVSDWEDIVAVSAGEYHTVGLKSDGTVVVVGDNEKGECDTYDWTNIQLPEYKNTKEKSK